MVSEVIAPLQGGLVIEDLHSTHEAIVAISNVYWPRFQPTATSAIPRSGVHLKWYPHRLPSPQLLDRQSGGTMDCATKAAAVMLHW